MGQLWWPYWKKICGLSEVFMDIFTMCAIKSKDRSKIFTFKLVEQRDFWPYICTFWRKHKNSKVPLFYFLILNVTVNDNVLLLPLIFCLKSNCWLEALNRSPSCLVYLVLIFTVLPVPWGHLCSQTWFDNLWLTKLWFLFSYKLWRATKERSEAVCN